jgi:hypothetical protein
VRRYRATTPAELDLIPVHDAWFDRDDVEYDRAARVLVIPFAQEALQWEEELLPSGIPQRQLVREATW